jgi:hypothetical protein
MNSTCFQHLSPGILVLWAATLMIRLIQSRIRPRRRGCGVPNWVVHKLHAFVL